MQSNLTFIGAGLKRPECVLTHSSGLLFAPDWRGNGGISVTSPAGESALIESQGPLQLRPNGIAMEPEGSFLLAHLGDQTGGVFRLFPDGSTETVLSHFDGEPLPPSNFICLDQRHRIWLTTSTTVRPRSLDYRSTASTGFIVMGDRHTGSVRTVATGLGYANECLVDEVHHKLYVNETFARRMAVYDLAADGSLSGYRVHARFGPGNYPDGMAMDAEGHILVASIVSNRLLRVAPDGSVTLLLEDCDPEHLAWVEDAWINHAMDREHLDNVKSDALKSVSNVAFGGQSLKTAFFGCLLGDAIASMPLPVAGIKPVHWNFPVQPVLDHIKFGLYDDHFVTADP